MNEVSIMALFSRLIQTLVITVCIIVVASIVFNGSTSYTAARVGLLTEVLTGGE